MDSDPVYELGMCTLFCVLAALIATLLMRQLHVTESFEGIRNGEKTAFIQR